MLGFFCVASSGKTLCGVKCVLLAFDIKSRMSKVQQELNGTLHQASVRMCIRLSVCPCASSIAHYSSLMLC